MNVGHGPALFLNWDSDSGTIDPPPNRDWAKASVQPNNTCDGLMPDKKTGGSSWPNDPTVATKHRLLQSKPRVYVTKDIELGQKYTYVRGCVAYQTMGIVGRTSFCFIFVPTGTADGHLTGDAVDCPAAFWAE
jgi:hypothetical protein